MTDVLLNVNVIQSIDDFFTKIFSSLKEAITWNTFWTCGHCNRFCNLFNYIWYFTDEFN